MEKCTNCKFSYPNKEIIYFVLSNQYKIPYCEKCYKQRLENEKQIWNNVLNGGHL